MEQENKQENRFEETMIEGRNAVLEAFRSGKTVDKLFVLDGCRMDRSRRSRERQKSRIRSSTMWRRRDSTSFLRPASIRA